MYPSTPTHYSIPLGTSIVNFFRPLLGHEPGMFLFLEKFFFFTPTAKLDVLYILILLRTTTTSRESKHDSFLVLVGRPFATTEERLILLKSVALASFYSVFICI